MDIDDVTDELYGLAPSDFVERRNQLAKAAKGDGNRDLRRQIAALRRPTQVGWAINQWVRTDPDGVAALLDLAAELLAAQRRSSADRLRALAERRQELVAECVMSVRRTADANGVELSDNAIRDVGQTLRAAVADDEIADVLRRGRLVTAAEYSGFGPAGVFLVPEPTGDGEAEVEPDAEAEDSSASSTGEVDTERLERARTALAEAEAAERDAEDTVRKQDGEIVGARQRADELSEDLERLRAELEQRDAEVRFARRQVETAEEQRRGAADDLDAARRRVDRARTALRRLERQN
ncbi:hypothetical protein V1Y59_15840 [Gordonia sp. PKS22-38]|uniref:Transposase n=1 Tax=Gordonia prachuapensis TaxID=3115651 RepID=A0ABU7MW38_9ACTN|nr:hypothetical protein [Gordonia sp. PKS22-38]